MHHPSQAGDGRSRVPKGFDAPTQLETFGKLLVYFASAALVLVAGKYFNDLIQFALADQVGLEEMSVFAGILSGSGILFVGFVATFAGCWVFALDTFTDLRLRHRYNAARLELPTDCRKETDPS